MITAVADSGTDRRHRILHEALRLFAEHGYEGTGMRAVAEAAGCRQSTLYHYFPNKDAIMEALIESAAERKFRAIDKARPDWSLREMLFRVGRSFLSSMAKPEARWLLQVILEAAQHHPAWGQQYLDELYDAPNEVLASWIAAKLPPSASAHVNPRWVAETFIGALFSFVLHEQILRRSAEALPSEAFLAQQVEVVTRGLTALASTDVS